MKKIIFVFGLTILFALNSFAQNQTPKVEETKVKPISYGLLVDNSGSIRSILEDIIKISQSVIEENNGDDKTFIVRFIDRENTSVIQSLTNQTEKLGNALEDLYSQGGQSAISHAILFSAKYLVEENEEDTSRQKILVVITDGDERDDKKLMKETLDYLQKNQIKVYFLGLSPSKISKSANIFMQFYAEGTNGKVFITDKTNNLQLSTQNLIKALRPN